MYDAVEHPAMTSRDVGTYLSLAIAYDDAANAISRIGQCLPSSESDFGRRQRPERQHIIGDAVEIVDHGRLLQDGITVPSAKAWWRITTIS